METFRFGVGPKGRTAAVAVLAVSAALFCLTFALVEGQKYGWTSTLILGLFSGSFISFLIFIAIERWIKAPLIPLHLFRNRTFSAGNSVGLILMFGLLSILFLLVLFLQTVLGYSAIKTGLVLLPMPIVIMIVAPLSGRFSDKIGSRWLLFCGMLLIALGIYLMSDLSLNMEWEHLILPLAVCGLGMGLALAPMTAAVMASAPMEKSGGAAGILATMRQVGAVLGISVIGAVLQNQLVTNVREALLPMSQIPPYIQKRILDELSSGRLGMGQSIPDLPGTLGNQIVQLLKEEFTRSLNSAMMISVFVCIAGAAVALVVRSHVAKGKTAGGVP